VADAVIEARWHRKLWRDAGFHWLNGYLEKKTGLTP